MYRGFNFTYHTCKVKFELPSSEKKILLMRSTFVHEVKVPKVKVIRYSFKDQLKYGFCKKYFNRNEPLTTQWVRRLQKRHFGFILSCPSEFSGG